MRAPPEGARVVRLDATLADLDDPAEVARQIPRASDLPAGTAVAVSGTATRRRGLLRAVLGDRKVAVSRAARCTALLSQGYVDLAASDEAAWGLVPGATPGQR